MNIVTKSYESLLPFLVVEAISSQSSSFNTMSVRLMDTGWAWLVCNKRLLIWKFNETKSQSIRTRRKISPSYELKLPQSDLIHKAELINIFFLPQNPNVSIRATTVPAVLAISPEGTIRFWHNLASERFAESSIVETQGQEFCTLTALSSLEYLLGTTTGSIYSLVIDLNASDAKSKFVCSPLEVPSGLLSGISRRMTNLFFGPMAATDSRRPLICAGSEKQFFVMCSTAKLRQWTKLGGQNNLVREWDLHKNIYRKISDALNITESHGLSFWPIDMIVNESKELLILIVTLDTSRDNTINYVIVHFNPYQAEDLLGKVTVLRSHSWNYSDETEDQLLGLRFLERKVNSNLCFLYDRKFLFLAKTDRDILDAVDYANQDDGILGAGMIDGQPLLFTQRDGLISVSQVVRAEEPMMVEIVESSASAQREEGEDPSQRINTTQRTEAGQMESESMTKDSFGMMSDVVGSVLTQSHSSNATAKLINDSTCELSMSRRKGDDVSEFLKDNKEFEWIQQIDSKQYGLACATLARLANESEALKDRRDTLLALSKLAGLAE